MPSPENPSPKRKGRAAVVIVAIVLMTIVAIFVVRNLYYVEEVEEGPPEGSVQTN
jgi:uncharacterized integral membrane protein